MHKIITLTRGKECLVDLEDYEWAVEFRWTFSPRSLKTDEDGYAARWVDRKKVYLHREITKCPKDMIVDHINGQGLDNRRCNLRITTQTHNRQNAWGGSSHKYKGITPARGRWRARLMYKGERFELGAYTTAEEAARAYDKKAFELFGPFAWVNFPVKEPKETAESDIPF